MGVVSESESESESETKAEDVVTGDGTLSRVYAGAAPAPLVQVMRELWPGRFPTPTAAKRAVRRGSVRVGGERASLRQPLGATGATATVACGERVEIDSGAGVAGARDQVQAPDEDGPPLLNGRPLLLEVCYEDDALAVVFKPAGVPTHGRSRRSLAGALPYALAPARSQPDALRAPQHCHRLDMPTSGLVVVGKTRRAVDGMRQLFESRLVHKTYRALVILGNASHISEGDAGTIDAPVGGRRALTHWRCVRVVPSLRHGALAELELRPHTGRTHQLRVHCASTLMSPILGDKLYSSDSCTTNESGCGLHLCATGIEFAHPLRGAEWGPPSTVCVATEPPPKFAARCRREAQRYQRMCAEA